MGSIQSMHQPGKKILSANPMAGAVGHGQHTADMGLICWQCPESHKSSSSESKPLKTEVSKITSLTSPTSRLEMSIRTAKLVIWLHWQAIWLWFLENSSHPLEDQAPVPPILWEKRHFWASSSDLPLPPTALCGSLCCKYQDRIIYNCHLPERVSSN